MKSLFVFFLTLGLHTVLLADGPKGAIFYRSYPGSPDDLALVAEYEQLESYSRLVNFVRYGGDTSTRVTQPNFIKIIAYPDIDSGTIATPQEIENLSKSITALIEASDKFPKAKPVISDDIERFTAAQKKLAQGNVLIAGSWRKSGETPAKDKTNDPNRVPELKVTVDGKDIVYKNVKVTGVDADRIRIFHSSGAASIPFESLPVSMQQKYKFDPNKAAEAQEERAKMVSQVRSNLARDAELAQQIKEGKVTSANMEVAKKASQQQLISQAEKTTFFVFQLAEGGALVNPTKTRTVGNSFGQGGNVFSSQVRNHDKMFFVKNPPSGLSDGKKFEAVVVPDGTYSYISVLGAQKTVEAYRIVTRADLGLE